MTDTLDLQQPGPGSTSTSLVDHLKRRDAEGWRRHVQLYGPLIYRWCRRGRLQPEDAADVIQEVFRTVAVRIHDFRRDRPGDSFRGWLWTITRHKIGHHLRRRQRQPNAAGGSDAQRGMLNLPEQLPDDEESAADFSALVHRAMDLVRVEFADRTWQAFWRTTAEGRTAYDVADELGVTPGAVRMAKCRVLRRLREELPDLADDERIPGY